MTSAMKDITKKGWGNDKDAMASTIMRDVINLQGSHEPTCSIQDGKIKSDVYHSMTYFV